MWIVFFSNIAAGISVISFQSELLQEVWGLADPGIGPATLAEYGATLIAVSSVCNGVGRLLWGSLCDRLGQGHRVPPSARQPDGGVRHPHDRVQSLDLLRARLLCAALLRRRLRHHAVVRRGRLRLEEHVEDLRHDSYRLGRRRDHRADVRRLPEGHLSRPGGDVLLPDRHPAAGDGIRLLIPAGRRPASPGPPDREGYAAPVRELPFRRRGRPAHGPDHHRHPRRRHRSGGHGRHPVGAGRGRRRARVRRATGGDDGA